MKYMLLKGDDTGNKVKWFRKKIGEGTVRP